MKTGDEVLHKPSGERWVVAAVMGINRISPMGWPMTLAAQSDCELIRECSEDEHVRDVLAVAKSQGECGDPRQSACRDLIEKNPQRYCVQLPPDKPGTCPSCGGPTVRYGIDNRHTRRPTTEEAAALL